MLTFLFLAMTAFADLPDYHDCELALVDLSEAQLQELDAIAEQLPEDLDEDYDFIALALIQFEESAIPFIVRVCQKYGGAKRNLYLDLLAERNVYGDRIERFEQIIGGDLDFGFELLKSDDPMVAEAIGNAKSGKSGRLPRLN